jgi:hypothetical protein
MTNLDADNVVMPLRPTKAKRADNTAALRQRRSRAKRKPSVTAPAAKPVQISGLEKANEIKADVTVSRAANITDAAPSKRTNYALVVIAHGFFALGIGINIWNAATGGALTDMALPTALGVLAEAVVFFLPAWALTLPIGRQVLAWALFAFISVFALTNSLRMASIIAADQTTVRADRRTEGVRTADHRLRWPEQSGTRLAAPVTASRLPAKSVRPRSPSSKLTRPRPRPRLPPRPNQSPLTSRSSWHG